jgi:hypothetical protein
MDNKPKRGESRPFTRWILVSIGIVIFVFGIMVGALISTPRYVTVYPPTPSITPIPDQVMIVIALQEIPCGVPIPPDAIGFESIPDFLAPPNAIFVLEQVIGKYAQMDVPRKGRLLTTMLVDSAAEVPSTCQTR